MNKNSAITLISLVAIIASFSSCNDKKKIQNYNYLTDPRDSSHSRIWDTYQNKIKAGDRLTISLGALDQESVKPYNFSSGSGNQIFVVDPAGYILYPQLGMVKAIGLSKFELRDTLIHRLKVYLKDPVVAVEVGEGKITMLGDVNRQGPISVIDGKITILEALGEAGDLKPSAKRDSILIIREINGTREFGTVSLLSNNIFKSPYFILRENDVVYVPAQKPPQEEKSFFGNAAGILSILTGLTSLAWFVYTITR